MVGPRRVAGACRNLAVGLLSCVLLALGAVVAAQGGRFAEWVCRQFQEAAPPERASCPGPVCAAPPAVPSPPPAAAAPPPRVAPLPVAGLWVPSGWMGDAAAGDALRYGSDTADPQRPGCQEWSYDPAQGSRGWCAVAYQSPENNWGEEKAPDLSKRGFVAVSFLARGKAGGERVLFKSGGHTKPQAAFPASCETSAGVVTLAQEWRRYRISLEGLDLSNTPTAFAFVVTRQLCPQGCVFYLDDLVFCGPGD